MKSLSTALGVLLFAAAFALGIYIIHVMQKKHTLGVSTPEVGKPKSENSKSYNDSINRGYEANQRAQGSN